MRSICLFFCFVAFVACANSHASNKNTEHVQSDDENPNTSNIIANDENNEIPDDNQAEQNYREALSCLFLKSFAYGVQKAVEEYAVDNRDANLSRAVHELNVGEYIRDFCPSNTKTKSKAATKSRHGRNKYSNNVGNANSTGNVDNANGHNEKLKLFFEQLWRQQDEKIAKLEQRLHQQEQQQSKHKHYEKSSNATQLPSTSLDSTNATIGRQQIQLTKLTKNEKNDIKTVEKVTNANDTSTQNATQNEKDKLDVKSRHVHEHRRNKHKYSPKSKNQNKGNAPSEFDYDYFNAYDNYGGRVKRSAAESKNKNQKMMKAKKAQKVMKHKSHNMKSKKHFRTSA